MSLRLTPIDAAHPALIDSSQIDNDEIQSSVEPQSPLSFAKKLNITDADGSAYADPSYPRDSSTTPSSTVGSEKIENRSIEDDKLHRMSAACRVLLEVCI